MRKISTLAFLAVATGAMAQTFGPGPGGAVGDGGTGTNTPGVPFVSDIVVTGQGANTVGSFVNVQLLGLTHTWMGDMTATLTHVGSGTTVELFDRIGRTGSTSFGNSADFAGNYTIVETGGGTFSDTLANPAGTYNRYMNGIGGGSISNTNTFAAFNGLSINGTWRLTLTDWAASDTGSLGQGWNFTVTPVPEPATLIALGLGAAALAARRRRSSK